MARPATTWAAGRIASAEHGRLTIDLDGGWGTLVFRPGAHLKARARRAMDEGRLVSITGNHGPRGPFVVSIAWDDDAPT